MKNRFLTLGLSGALLLLAAAATAQTTPVSPAAYAGPRYPGGPDSLRVYLTRHALRQAGKGPVFVQFDVLPRESKYKPTLILPPNRAALSSAMAAKALSTVTEMPAWTPGQQDVEIPITTVTLCLTPASTALAYADEMPVFPGVEPGIIGFYRFMPGIQVVTPEIIKRKLTGDVFVYFEVSDTGQLEKAQVIGGSEPALNDAALRTVARLPTRATIPAQLHGRPVRVYYVLSIGFASD